MARPSGLAPVTTRQLSLRAARAPGGGRSDPAALLLREELQPLALLVRQPVEARGERREGRVAVQADELLHALPAGPDEELLRRACRLIGDGALSRYALRVE